MKILSIGSDRNLFDPSSSVAKRVIEYGSLVEELHVVVFVRDSLGFQKVKLSENVFVYPTSSKNRWHYVLDAYKLGKHILFENTGSRGHLWLVSTQDPFESGLVGYWLKKKHNIPLQIQIHTDFLSPFFGKESTLNKIRLKIASLTIPAADGIRVVSKRIKDSLNSRFKVPNSKITVLPIFVDTAKYLNKSPSFDLHEKYPQFDFMILAASRLSREKNIDLAIEAMREVVTKHPKTGLVIVGSGPEKKNLESRILNLGLQKNVVMEDWTDDLSSYYKIADLFLLTSNYEGYGLTLVEAAISGCPIITTDVGLVGDVLTGEVCFIFQPGDISGLVEAILKVRQIPGLARLMAKKASEIARSLPGKRAYLYDYKRAWDQAAL